MTHAFQDTTVPPGAELPTVGRWPRPTSGSANEAAMIQAAVPLLFERAITLSSPSFEMLCGLRQRAAITCVRVPCYTPPAVYWVAGAAERSVSVRSLQAGTFGDADVVCSAGYPTRLDAVVMSGRVFRILARTFQEPGQRSSRGRQQRNGKRLA